MQQLPILLLVRIIAARLSLDRLSNRAVMSSLAFHSIEHHSTALICLGVTEFVAGSCNVQLKGTTWWRKKCKLASVLILQLQFDVWTVDHMYFCPDCCVESHSLTG